MADGLVTLIGPSILVNGNLEGDEDLTVLGRVQGSISLTRTLNIEESGIVKADVSVRNAIISGVLVGNVQATESVEITEVGRVVGDIKAPRVIIVDGARFRGNVDMGDLEAPRPSGPLPARKATSTALVSSSGSARASLPARRPTPVTKTSAAPATKTKSSAAPTTADKASTAPATATASTAAPRMAPIAVKKKVKKKVVVKKP
jgi:cytoskeletal protein CcmA (bactofilin family)